MSLSPLRHAELAIPPGICGCDRHRQVSVGNIPAAGLLGQFLRGSRMARGWRGRSATSGVAGRRAAPLSSTFVVADGRQIPRTGDF
jgi:hypothetical protein